MTDVQTIKQMFWVCVDAAPILPSSSILCALSETDSRNMDGAKRITDPLLSFYTKRHYFLTY